MYSVYQHWDPLKVCVVGQSYPPEFYSWISNSTTRSKFEKLAQETEQDYQHLVNLLKNKFGVEIVRPQLPNDLNLLFVDGKWIQPPTAPRDYFLMIHDKFWVPHVPNASHAWSTFYRQSKQDGWADYVRPEDFAAARPHDWHELKTRFSAFRRIDQQHLDTKLNFYAHIFDKIESNSNQIVRTDLDFVNGCFVSRIGDHLYFATQTYHDNQTQLLDTVNSMFPTTTNQIVNAGGHGDAVYCPVCPGLIISLNDVPTYANTFPDWEVVYLSPSNYAHMRKFQSSMKQNKGRWFMPGFENHYHLQQMVNHYFDEWVGQVSETVFDVNILIVDSKNIVVSSHNDLVEKACARHGIEVHVSPFRHKYFWDCGTHCATNDLHRDGTLQSYFAK